MMFLQRFLGIVFILSNFHGGASFISADTGKPGPTSLSGRMNVPQQKQPSATTEQSASSLSASWASYITIDPSNILSVLVKKAGFFLDPKLKDLANLLHCDEAKLNVAKKELLITNFTVSLPDADQGSLKIGRIHVTWDSYRRPCVDIQVENVDILVEFVNLFFTKNNWDELNEHGFPPEVVYMPVADDGDAETAKTTHVFVRIGSLDLTGQVILRTRSRPLRAPLSGDIVLKLTAVRDLNQRIRKAAEANKDKTRRPGCTSDEIYDIFQAYFSAKVKEAVKFALEDLAAGKIDSSRDSRIVGESKKIASSTKAALLRYMDGLEAHSKEKLKERLVVTGEEGDSVVSDKEIENMLSEGVATLKTSFKSMGIQALRKLDEIREFNKNSTKVVVQEDEIMFPDW